MTLARYFVGALLVVSMPPAIVWWLILHPFVGFWRRMGARRALVGVTVLSVALLLALVPLRNALLGRDLGTCWPLVGVAAAGIVAAGVLAAQRRRYLTFRILSGLPELEGRADLLLTEGPYARVRHPRYLEVVIAALAYACFANYVGAYIVAFLTLPLLHVVVVLEERELARRFGASWERYRAAVPRWVPRWRPGRGS